MSRRLGLLSDDPVQAVVAQTIKGGMGPGDGESAPGLLLAQPVVLLILAGVVTLIVWTLMVRAARRARARSESADVRGPRHAGGR